MNLFAQSPLGDREMFDIKKEVLAAEGRIRPFIRETLLDYSIPLSRATGCQVFLKCETLQYTGSFKVRGAFSKILSLSQAQRELGIVTASTGNHGAGVAYALHKLNLPGIIFVTQNCSPTKVENIRNYASQLELVGQNFRETKAHALKYAEHVNMTFVPPYNDWQVIAGQGTIGLELERQLKHIDAVFVSIGGGGLISGIGGYLKETFPHIKIIGCLPENAPVMAECIKAGRIIQTEVKPTISDATKGVLEPDSVTFELCQKYVDDYILVSEEEIKNSIALLLRTHHHLIEGAAGVAVASFLKVHQQFQNKNVVVLLSGANISIDDLKIVIS
jgi:threonine dehydratase